MTSEFETKDVPTVTKTPFPYATLLQIPLGLGSVDAVHDFPSDEYAKLPPTITNTPFPNAEPPHHVPARGEPATVFQEFPLSFE
jgi:hypothetical protein